MKDKINVAELLRYCPSGMELDCSMWDNLYFDRVEDDLIHCYYVLDGYRNATMFLKDGCYTAHKLSKCVIFPKDKTTWEGFIPPCKFKDGDVIYAKSKPILNTELVGIYKKEDDERIYDYCSVSLNSKSFYHHNVYGLIHKSIIDISRLATEEEKQKLFDVIKANGYKWNAETKVLEKLVEPKFKVGDEIVKRNSISNSWIVSSVSSEYYGLKLPKGVEGIGVLPVSEQDDWELLPNIKPKFKVGDRVKSVISSSCYTIVDIKNDQYFIKSDTEKYPYQVPFSYEINYELVSDKFDINTLKPFDKVLVRCGNGGSWTPQFFANYKPNSKFPFVCTYNSWSQCIPYEGNEHLLGTTDDCDEYYKTWENLCLKI